MEWITEPWPWYVAGPLIALTMFLLLLAGKQFGMSSNLRTACSAVGCGKAADFFNFDWKAQRWNLTVVAGDYGNVECSQQRHSAADRYCTHNRY